MVAVVVEVMMIMSLMVVMVVVDAFGRVVIDNMVLMVVAFGCVDSKGLPPEDSETLTPPSSHGNHLAGAVMTPSKFSGATRIW